MDEERKLFEAWALDLGLEISRWSDDSYIDATVAAYWRCWHAAVSNRQPVCWHYLDYNPLLRRAANAFTTDPLTADLMEGTPLFKLGA